MKVTKNILREIIEAEMNLLNEATERTGFLNLRSAERTVGKLETLLNKYEEMNISPGRKNRLMQRFRRLWNAISGGVVKVDLEIDGNKTKLGEIVERAIALNLIDDIVNRNIADDNTAEGTRDPDPTRTQNQMDAAIEEIEEEESSDDSASEETAASATGTTTGAGGILTDPEKAMLQAIATQGGRVLKRGSSSPKVGLLQSVLAKRLEGDEPAITALGTPDNDFGPKTKAAVEKLQSAYGMSAAEVDGAVGKNTAASLLAGVKTDGVAVRRSRAARDNSAGSETAAAETYASSDPFGNNIGIWNPDAKVWFATNWARASAAATEAGFNTAIKLENEDGVRYVRKAGDALTEDDINELLADDGAPTEDSVPYQQGGESTDVVPEAVNYFKRFTRYLNEIESMRDERSFIDIMAVEDPVEDAPGEEDADEEAEATDSVNVGRLAEIVALLEVTNFTEWTEPEFVRGFEDWIVNGFGDNDFRNEFSYLSAQFEEKLDRMLNYDFSGGYGGNLSDFEKNDFKEKTGATSLSNLKPGKLTKDALTRQLTQTDTSYSNSRVEDAWNKFIGTEGAYYGHASLRTTLKLRKSADDESGSSFVYTGPDEFIILLAAMKKLRRMRDNLTGFSEASEPEGVSESLSYDRFQKLAGLLKG